MPSDLTIFAASKLVYVDAVLALAVVVFLMYREPRISVVRWLVTVAAMLVLSFVLAKIGAQVYSDARPFTTDHVKPLIAHAPDNGFPSDHALLAAAIVAAVLLISPLWAAPFVVLAVLVNWARVGAGIHHVGDVLGSSLFVAFAMGVAYVLAPQITRLLVPYLPSWQGVGQE